MTARGLSERRVLQVSQLLLKMGRRRKDYYQALFAG